MVSQFKLDCASSSLSSSPLVDSEAHFELPEYGVVGMVDCEESDVANLNKQPPSMYMKFVIKSVLDSFIEEAIRSGEESMRPFSWRRLECLLSQAFEQFPISNIVSCCIMKMEGERLFCATIGTCGFVIIRDDKVFYDTRPSCLQILESAYESNSIRKDKLPYLESHIRYNEISVQEDDVVIIGNRGFLWHISNEQIIAYLRPVSNSFDSTLSIANYTSLGYLRQDDPRMISYMLTHIAYHFADNGSFLSLEYPRNNSMLLPTSSLYPISNIHLVACISCIVRRQS
ncbi:uncharacterized protein Gasu_58620 [Galdieria sulphuraria]|uniref:Uncharacterized protein n=1 Tax=Galdieria sulphuraria TaxID=130081 RepID=M2XSY6_GALSU|nr:uncharacterized protein Gasu_58620 [Galdieria sulphuraria]EME26539.1 hypothetical protein Gasu_58620 [Galdieria sulphuraria]|eukprot:XP_005703059.1 hypothetical protein Gasu_58620 [Galdieria sulphuraria]